MSLVPSQCYQPRYETQVKQQGLLRGQDAEQNPSGDSSEELLGADGVGNALQLQPTGAGDGAQHTARVAGVILALGDAELK